MIMIEIKRYRCIKEFLCDAYDEDGFYMEGKSGYIEPGSIWQEGKDMIAGGEDNVHLDREDVPKNVLEWCEPTKEMLPEYFEQLESIFV